MDAKNLQKLAQLKRQLSEAELKAKGLTLDTYDFSKAVKKAAKRRAMFEDRPKQDPKVYDPAVPNADVAIKVKRKVKGRKRRNRASGKPPAWAFDPSMQGNITTKTPNSAKPKTPKPKRNDWINAKCTICRADFVYLPEWVPVPVLCNGCRSERKGKYKTKSDGRTQFAHSTFVPGGAPGTGKRR